MATVTRISSSDLPKLFILARNLPLRGNPLTKYLWEQLSDETKTLIEGSELAPWDFPKALETDPEIQFALIKDFNRIIRSGPLYTPDRFRDVKLSSGTMQGTPGNSKRLKKAETNRA